MSDRPHILVTMADDQRRSAWSGAGRVTADAVATPALAALAGRGTAFSRASHAGSPCGAVCVASRAMLHAGSGPCRVPEDLLTMAAPPAFVGPAAAAGTTLAERLRAAGYATAFTGKWHNGAEALLRGFDAAESVFLGGMGDPFRLPLQRLEGGRLSPAPLPGVHATDAFTHGALALLRRHLDGPDAGKPLFLLVAYTAPHDPRTTHAQWHDRCPPGGVVLPPNAWPERAFDNGALDGRDEWLTPLPRDPGQTRREIADYHAVTTHMDAGIGRLHAALRGRGVAGRTLVAHTADHGLALGQHGLMGKQNLHEHSVGVPLILAGPGVPAGLRHPGLCLQHDLHPTLLEAAGAAPGPAPAPGSPFRSLLPALADPAAPLRPFTGCFYRGVQRSVTLDCGWKLIRCAVGGHRWEQAFHLPEDPWELHPLALADCPADRADALRAALEAWAAEHGDPDRDLFCAPSGWSLPPADVNRWGG